MYQINWTAVAVVALIYAAIMKTIHGAEVTDEGCD